MGSFGFAGAAAGGADALRQIHERGGCGIAVRKALVLALVAALALPTSAFATIAVGQVVTANGQDATCTFSSAPPATSLILFLASISANSQTLSIAGATEVARKTHATAQIRSYAFTAVGDGSTAAFTIENSGSSIGQTFCVEVTGANLASYNNAEGLGSSTASTSHGLDSDIAVTASVLLFSITAAAAAASFTTGADFTQLATPGVFTRTHAQYRAVSAGSYAAPMTTADTADTATVAIAITEDGGGAARACIIGGGFIC